MFLFYFPSAAPPIKDPKVSRKFSIIIALEYHICI